MSVKFCGFRTKDDVKTAVSHAVSAIGFILVPDRKRTISLLQLTSMIPLIPKQIEKVGVFQNPTLEEVNNAASLGLSMVQLHGQETPAFCQQIKKNKQIPIIKVFSEKEIQKIPLYEGYIDVVLLDHSAGGTGTTIDWSCIPVAKQLTERLQLPLWIAGGLNESNIENLIRDYEIDGIDLSSGIETNGKKDTQKMNKIIERMKQHDKIEQ
nr:phosphoribosylanthranilate isomerase [Shimazuella kribbensis]